METTSIQLKHGKVRVHSEGPQDGPVVCWVHGASYPLDVFSLLVPSFIEQGYRCIRFDLYGRGESTWDYTKVTTELLAEQTLDVLAHFEIKTKVHLVSLSNSDLVLNCVARMRPDLIETITWIAPSGTDRRTMNPFFRGANLIPGMDSVLKLFMKPYLIGRMRSHRENLNSEQASKAGPIYDTSIRSLQESPFAVQSATNYFLNLPSRGTLEIDLVAVAGARIPVMMIMFGQEKDALESDLSLFRKHIQATEVYLEEGSHMGLLEYPDLLLPHMLRFMIT